MATLLEVLQLSKSFGHKNILTNFKLSCKTGEIVGIFGRNGCGKSTLLKLLQGSVKADSFKVQINKEPILAKNIIPLERIAYLPQDSFLPKSLKVREIIPMFFEKGAAQDKIFYAKNVSHLANLPLGKLSAGQLRYLEILLVGHLPHPFLMLDEPFSMIEPLYKEIIKEFLIQLKKTKGILLTDHYYTDVLSITTKNFLLKDAKKYPISNVKDLKHLEYLYS